MLQRERDEESDLLEEGSKRKNSNLHKAKQEKNDEFYTILSDIENELQHYNTQLFKDKVILCNCDDPFESNFFKYFFMKFEKLQLKKLICTCYKGSAVAGSEVKIGGLFDEIEKQTRPHKIEISREDYEQIKKDLHIEFSPIADDIKELLEKEAKKRYIEHLEGDGDFQSDECIKLLKQADIVITNPPFSLFRKFIDLLYEYNKKFIVIGNKNAITYKEVFKHIKDNEMWLGVSTADNFIVVDKTGNKTISKQVNGLTRWFTNLPHNKRYEKFIFTKTYKGHESEYPKYDNYDAIEVNKTKDIPSDYDGVMGVPITFLDKFNPEQFEIVAFRKGSDGKDLVFTNEREREYIHTSGCSNAEFNERYPLSTKNLVPSMEIKGKNTYRRLLVKRK